MSDVKTLTHREIGLRISALNEELRKQTAGINRQIQELRDEQSRRAMEEYQKVISRAKTPDPEDWVKGR